MNITIQNQLGVSVTSYSFIVVDPPSISNVSDILENLSVSARYEETL